MRRNRTLACAVMATFMLNLVACSNGSQSDANTTAFETEAVQTTAESYSPEEETAEVTTEAVTTPIATQPVETTLSETTPEETVPQTTKPARSEAELAEMMRGYIKEYDGKFVNFAYEYEKNPDSGSIYAKIVLREDSQIAYPKLKEAIDTFNDQRLTRLADAVSMAGGYTNSFSYMRADDLFFSFSESFCEERVNGTSESIRGFNFFTSSGAEVKIEDILTNVDEAIARIGATFTVEDIANGKVSFVLGATEIVFIVPTDSGSHEYKALSYYGNKDLFTAAFQPTEGSYVCGSIGGYNFFDEGSDGKTDIIYTFESYLNGLCIDLNGESMTAFDCVISDWAQAIGYVICNNGNNYFIHEYSGWSSEYAEVYSIRNGKLEEVESEYDDYGHLTGGPIVLPNENTDTMEYKVCVPVDGDYLFLGDYTENFFDMIFIMTPVDVSDTGYIVKEDDYRYTGYYGYNITAKKDIKAFAYPDNEEVTIPEGTVLRLIYGYTDETAGKLIFTDIQTGDRYMLLWDYEKGLFTNGSDFTDIFDNENWD